jgi:hypothetical protein
MLSCRIALREGEGDQLRSICRYYGSSIRFTERSKVQSSAGIGIPALRGDSGATMGIPVARDLGVVARESLFTGGVGMGIPALRGDSGATGGFRQPVISASEWGFWRYEGIPASMQPWNPYSRAKKSRVSFCYILCESLCLLGGSLCPNQNNLKSLRIQMVSFVVKNTST